MASTTDVAEQVSPRPLPFRERRLWQRLACTRPIPRRLLLEPNHQLQDGWVVDLSVAGLGLLLNLPLEPGEILSVELESHPHCSPVTLRVRVVHVRLLPEGDWLLGCQFLNPISEEKLEDLLM